MRKFLTVLFCVLLLAAWTCAEEARDITAACAITCQNGKTPNVILDDSVETHFKAGDKGCYIRINIPEGEAAGGLLVDWYENPRNYSLVSYDASGNEIDKTDQSDRFTCLCQYFGLTPETRSVRLDLEKGSDVSSIHVYSEGALPEYVQLWQEPVKKADLMLISTHQDDEELWFGGMIPYYDVQMDRSMIVVYMTDCGRTRKGESLNGLWSMGVKTYPEFLSNKDHRCADFQDALDVWGGSTKVNKSLADVIRKYRPEVIVTHDINGEYGHLQHKLLSSYIVSGAKAAADETRFKDSRKAYGTWQVKKVYRHLGKENVIYMDWETPAEELNGLTPLEVATIGFECHKSQTGRWSMERGKQYDNSKFSLVYTTVGPDQYKDDLLENTPADLRLKTTATPEPTFVPTPEPAFEPTPEPTFVPTPEPTCTNSPEPVQMQTDTMDRGFFLLVIFLLVLLGLPLISGVLSRRKTSKKKHRKKKHQTKKSSHTKR